MGIIQETEEYLRKESVTKIQGQPREKDVTMLVKQLGAIVRKVPTSIGGGNHGHLGLIMEDADYQQISNGGVAWVTPNNPGHYPENIPTGAPSAVRERFVAEHKASKEEFERCQGVINALRALIQEAVKEEYLSELDDPIHGFFQISPLEMLKHLKERGGDLDYTDKGELKAIRDREWDVGNEHIATHFAKVQEAKERLERAGMETTDEEMIFSALLTIKRSGELTRALERWEERDEGDQTWTELKKFFAKEYSKKERHEGINAREAGYGSASNVAEKSNQAAEDKQLLVLAAMTDVVQQMNENFQEALMAQAKETAKLMKQMCANVSGGSQDKSGSTNDETKDKNKPKCKHCGRAHLNKIAENECWKLPENIGKAPEWFKKRNNM